MSKFRSFTVDEVAKVCKVAPRTVTKWFESGRVKGYRLPGSQAIRIPRDFLVEFLKSSGSLPEVVSQLEADESEDSDIPPKGE